MKKELILITGPESTGKSSLAERLSLDMSIPYLPEYARLYLEKNGPQYNYEDILQIAKDHVDLLSIISSEITILDTFLLNLYIWCEYKYGKKHLFIIENLSKFKPKHTLLLYPDIDWTPDTLRNNPNNRVEIFTLFEDKLKQLNWSYSQINGQDENRIKQGKEELLKFI